MMLNVFNTNVDISYFCRRWKLTINIGNVIFDKNTTFANNKDFNIDQNSDLTTVTKNCRKKHGIICIHLWEKNGQNDIFFILWTTLVKITFLDILYSSINKGSPNKVLPTNYPDNSFLLG